MTLVYRVLEEKCLCVGGSTVRETMIFLAVKDVRLVMGAIGCLVCESRGKDKLNQASPPNVHRRTYHSMQTVGATVQLLKVDTFRIEGVIKHLRLSVQKRKTD